MTLSAKTSMISEPGVASGHMPFNRPYTTGTEFTYIQEAIDHGHLSGNGPFTERCAAWLEKRTGGHKALLTGSCTMALEMAAILADVGPGDEVIMPSFTFVSTASAVALRGATPVFVEIRPDTLNIDEECVEPAITSRTRAVLPVHYAGVACEMEALASIADAHGLMIIEDAAQGVMASHRGDALGGIGALGCLSFHETKNVMCGEGGALIVNRPELVERAEILQEKGTNRSQFFRGEVDRYTWVELGSSFLTSEINAAFLWAQLEQAETITARRKSVWDRYHSAFDELERRRLLRRPVVPADREHNAHMYYILLPDGRRRDRVISVLAERGIQAVSHYVPLHSSPAGWRYGRAHGNLALTTELSERLLRVPLWIGMTDEEVDRVVTSVTAALGSD